MTKYSTTTIKICKKHGSTEHVRETNGYFRCKRCRNDHVIANRRNSKFKLVEEFGGKCKICGYNKCIGNLTFHHLDPSKKEFQISQSGRTLSIKKLRLEANKCVLLCHNCHGEVHAGLIQI